MKIIIPTLIRLEDYYTNFNIYFTRVNVFFSYFTQLLYKYWHILLAQIIILSSSDNHFIWYYNLPSYFWRLMTRPSLVISLLSWLFILPELVFFFLRTDCYLLGLMNLYPWIATSSGMMVVSPGLLNIPQSLVTIHPDHTSDLHRLMKWLIQYHSSHHDSIRFLKHFSSIRRNYHPTTFGNYLNSHNNYIIVYRHLTTLGDYTSATGEHIGS